MDFVRGSQCGFTLIEVIVAIGIFSVLSVGSYRVVNGIVNAQERISQHSENVREISRAIRIIESDFQHIIDRKILDENGDQLASYLADPKDYKSNKIEIDFTRNGLRNPIFSKRSEVVRVSYGYQNKIDRDDLGGLDLSDYEEINHKNSGYIFRYVWPVLDRGNNIQPDKQLLLSNISSFEIQYYDNNGEWISTWPPLTNIEQKISEIPYAIKIIIMKNEKIFIERVFSARRLPD